MDDEEVTEEEREETTVLSAAVAAPVAATASTSASSDWQAEELPVDDVQERMRQTWGLKREWRRHLPQRHTKESCHPWNYFQAAFDINLYKDWAKYTNKYAQWWLKYHVSQQRSTAAAVRKK